MSASFEQRNLAVIEGVEAIDPEFVLHLATVGHLKPRNLVLEDPVVLARAFTDWLQAGRPTRVQS